MAEAFLIQRGGGGAKIDGAQVSNYTVASGYTVKAGDFVRAETSTTVRTALSTDADYIGLVGVAKTSGASGATIKVYVP